VKVELITTTASLAALEHGWDRLAGNPFCNWDWLEAWWRHYSGTIGCDRGAAQLFTLCVYDENGALAAVAPWYLKRSAARGRVLRFLGCGEVWSDHLTVPCREGLQGAVAEALARWLNPQPGELCQGAAQSAPRWDLLDLRGIDAEDAVLTPLAQHLAARGCSIRRQQDEHCWQIHLPDHWESYLKMLSKSHRKQLRQLERRYFDTGHAVLHTVQNEDDLQRAWPIMTGLHQKRLQSLGEKGCFSSPVFAAFHRAVAARMLARNRLHLHWLELAGRPIAAEYHLAQDGVIYAYQGGIDPAALGHEPGRLITMAALQRAIRQGYRAFDFLRGDEPYKAHWRATPRPALRLQVIARRASAQLRYGLCNVPASSKQWLKRGWQTVECAWCSK
jgi:CelD/BcsL family acetyltransferase involved in cellulose biosynthesis